MLGKRKSGEKEWEASIFLNNLQNQHKLRDIIYPLQLRPCMYHHHTLQSLTHSGTKQRFLYFLYLPSLSIRSFLSPVFYLPPLHLICPSSHLKRNLLFTHKLTHTHFHTHTHSAKQFREALSKKHEMDCGLAMIIKQRAKVRTCELPYLQHTHTHTHSLKPFIPFDYLLTTA
jgi:hypothetical protein